MNTLVLRKYGKSRPMTFTINSYRENNNLYIGLVTWEDGYPEPWSNLTVNLSVKLPKDTAFIDTNNNGNEIIEWLETNGLGKATGRVQTSGWCVYPEFKFNMSEIKKYMEE